MSDRQSKTSDLPSLQVSPETVGSNMSFSLEHPLIETLLQIKSDIIWLHSSFTEQINEVKRAVQELADSQQYEEKVTSIPDLSSISQKEA